MSAAPPPVDPAIIARQIKADHNQAKASIVAAGLNAVVNMIETVVDEATRSSAKDDAFSAAIVNLSSRSWVVKPGTSEPVRGQWVKPPNKLTSVYGLAAEEGALSKDDIASVLEAFEGKGMGLAPWTYCTLANAGGYWGPASVIVFQDPEDQMTVTLMMLLRPGFDYCAGVSLSRMWIGNKGDGQGWEMFKHIETVHTDKCQFSDGVRKEVSWNGVKVSWQPAKSMTFVIEDV